MNSTRHLSEEQMEELLMGELAAEPAAHLAACEPCQVRAAAAEAPIASFKAVSLAWSERRSATLPVQLAGDGRAAWQRRASWTLAGMAVLLTAIAIPVTRHETRGARVVASGTTPDTVLVASAVQEGVRTAKGPSQSGAGQLQRIGIEQSSDSQEARIARDNRMLEAIDRELDAPVQSPSDAFGLVAGGNRSTAHGHFGPVEN